MILIRNGFVLTQNKKRQKIKNGAILIKDDKIKAIGKTKDLERKYQGQVKKVIEAKNKVVMPGLINAHTHLAMTLLRGYADDLPLEQWWLKKIYPIESKFTKEDVYLGSLLGGLEMIKSGTTCFVDFYYFEDEVAKAAKILGIRANLGVGILDFKTFAFKNIAEVLKEAIKIIKKYKNDELIKISLAPHMLQTASLKTYKTCKKLTNKYGLLLQTHLAETEKEIKYCLKKYGESPAELLIKNKVLDENSLVAHACYLTDKEIKLLAKNKVKIAHCPISNMKLASGIMPLSKLLKAGAVVSLGTDGACSNNSLDMFEEMKVTALLHKFSNKNPTAADAQTVLDMATINGAKALGMGNQIGSLEVDKKADLIILDFNQPHLMPVYNTISHLVYAAKGSDVETVIINGRIVMENRKILTVDEGKILTEIRQKF